MVTFEMFIRPAIRKMAGHCNLHRSRIRVRIAEDIRSPDDLTHYYRVRLARSLDGELEATLTGPQGSGMLTSMVQAHGLAVVPIGVRAVEQGDYLDVILLDDCPS